MADADAQLAPKDIRLVITASSLGTIFEWYDFFIYGTLAAQFGKLFFPPDNPTAGFLLALATFGVGFAVRPFGAAVFGVLGDTLGRKYTFLVTITLMGVATAAIGLLGTYAQIGIAAPILLVLLRIAQGLAIGGEYGGAAIYVAEHAPPDKRGFYTSFIQIGAISGLALSLIVVLATTAALGEEAWNAWGWRLPFLFSLVLLAISLWVRLKLSESPVFAAMKAAGETARNPLRETFASWPKVKMLAAVLLGIAAGQSITGYVALFQSLNFLQGAQHVDPTATRTLLVIACLVSVGWNVLFGWLSDRIGRKPPVIAGYVLFLLLLFPLFHFMADRANPALASAMQRSPVVVTGSNCSYNPFAQHGQATPCGALLDILSKKGVAYTKIPGESDMAPVVTIGDRPVDANDPVALQTALVEAGYPPAATTPPLASQFLIIGAIVLLFAFSGMTYGPIAAWMVELFPPHIRYTSISLPYHIGVGYFSGFMPFIVQYIVARTGDPFSGFWYPFAVVAVSLIVALVALPETNPRRR
jgi:MFS family permease